MFPKSRAQAVFQSDVVSWGSREVGSKLAVRRFGTDDDNVHTTLDGVSTLRYAAQQCVAD